MDLIDGNGGDTLEFRILKQAAQQHARRDEFDLTAFAGLAPDGKANLVRGAAESTQALRGRADSHTARGGDDDLSAPCRMIGQRRWHERGFTRTGWGLNDDVSGFRQRIDGLGYGQSRADASEIKHLVGGSKTLDGTVEILALPGFLIVFQLAHHAAG